MKTYLLSFFLIVVLSLQTIQANVKLASVFTDNMVLQANQMIKVWGTASPAEAVTVEINGNKAETRAGFDGKWQLELAEMKYGGPYSLNVFGDDTLTLKNVMVGEVWLCGGQSNMHMTVNGVKDSKQESTNANYANIRFLTIPKIGSTTRLTDIDAKWEVCSPVTVNTKTAVGYFFGRQLHERLNVAIGLIDISYGGATILTFMDHNDVENTSDTAVFKATQKQRWKEYYASIVEWEKKRRNQQRPPYLPQHFSSLCYNAMIQPLIPFTCKGFIWYQGETDASYPDAYVSWFGDFLAMMRIKFNNPQMPVYYVQLAGFENQFNTKILPEAWARFRLAQEECLKYSNTGMATAMDIGMKDNIHPVDKQEVGRRLALCALNETYGKNDLISKGPVLNSIEKRNKSYLLRFDHCVGGLKSREKGNVVRGFSAVLENGEVIEIEGRIKSANTIEISGSGIKRLRYAYANFPVCPLYNSERLPALPFDRKITQVED